MAPKWCEYFMVHYVMEPKRIEVTTLSPPFTVSAWKQSKPFLMFFGQTTTSFMLGLWSGDSLEHTRPSSNIGTSKLLPAVAEQDPNEAFLSGNPSRDSSFSFTLS